MFSGNEPAVSIDILTGGISKHLGTGKCFIYGFTSVLPFRLLEIKLEIKNCNLAKLTTNRE